MSQAESSTASAEHTARSYLRKPRLITICALAISFALATLLAFTATEFSQATARASNEHATAQDLSAEIVYRDEVLTMSALLAASTSNSVWLDRYDANVVLLDDALADTRVLGATGLFPTDGLDQVDEANQTLLDLEEQALDLVRAGQRGEGLALLESSDYLDAKAAYSEGIGALSGDIGRSLKAAKDSARNRAATALAIAAVAGLATFALAAFTWRSLSAWRQQRISALVEFQKTDEHQRSALSEMQVQLDTLAANSGIDWWQVDTDGFFLNAKGQDMKELKPHLSFDPTEDRPSAFEVLKDHPGSVTALRQALQGEIVYDRFVAGETVKQTVLLPQLRDGEVQSVMGISHDVSAEVRLQRELQHQAEHDSLTGLLNRSGFEKIVDARLADAETTASMLLLEISGLRALNDLRGYEVGDRALIVIAARVKRLVGSAGVAARIGGVEFCVFVSGLNEERTDALADELADCVRSPIADTTGPVILAAAVGYDGPVLHGRTFRRELPALDVAIGHAPNTRDDIARFLPSMMTDFAEENARIKELAEAIENRELHVAFQPIWDVASGQIVGAEALARWTHAERGPISPGEFIPRAEKAGLIRDLDRLILELACEHLADWTQSHPALRDQRLSINLSADDLADEGLSGRIEALCVTNGLTPSNLLFELTESSAVENLSMAQERLHELRALGCKLALDDFGTGYSSLGHLHNLAVDVLKIDRSFVSGNSANRQELCQMIVGLAKLLGLRVVAEGVETLEQLDDIRRLGCDYVQGFHLARPLAATDFHDLVIELGEGSHRAFGQLEQHSGRSR